MAKKPTKGAYEKAAVFIDRKPTTRKTRFKAGALVDVATKINKDGLALLANHDSSRFPIGMWYKAKVDENEQVIAQFYIPKEVAEFDDVSTRIEAGILDSVSIGFTASIHDCSVCGNDIQDYENCPHIPGRTYEGEIAYVELGGIKASEGSLVYSGAVPNAKIQDTYSGDCKEGYCKANKFDEGELMIATGGLLLQDINDNKTIIEGTDMEIQKQFDALTVKFDDKSTKFDEVTAKYTALLEKTGAQSAGLEKIATYKADVAAAVAVADEAIVKFEEAISKVTAQVVALAAPFEATYEAPKDLETLLTDMAKFTDLAKTLPEGQQSLEPGTDDVEFKIPESHYKV